MGAGRLYNRFIIMVTCFLPLAVNALTFTCQKGASGRALKTVRMYTNETTKNDADTVDVQMQSTHEFRQIIYINDKSPKTNRYLRLQTTQNGKYLRWFRYDSHVALNTNTGYFKYTGTSSDFGVDGKIYTTAQTYATVTTSMLSSVPSKPTIIACDYSGYSDKTKSNGVTYSEPTIYYRMIYELHPASEIAAKLNPCTSIDNCLETYNLIAPSGGQTIILSPKYPYDAENNGFQSNYYIGTTTLTQVTSGTWYEVSSSGTLTALAGTKANAQEYTFTGSTSPGKHTYVLVYNNGGTNYYIAKFIVDYQDVNTVGPSSTEIHSDNYLSSNYKEIAERRFDFNTPTNGNQAWSEPLAFDESTYGFVYSPANYTVNKSSNSTLDLTNISTFAPNWANYTFLSSSAGIGGWAYTTFKDRLYERTNGAKRGYFYYVDAAETQGLVAKLDISQACCAGTELYLSAWVANVNSKGGLPPNLNFEISALNGSGEEVSVTTFTTGNFGDTSTGANNKWMQVFFNFEIPRGTNYKNLYLNVINNQVSSSGDDFIIDDIVAYMEKPAIEAEQTALLCGQTAQVKVHIDYNQMLKLTALEGASTATSLTIGYCFVDSAKYMSEVNAGIDKSIALGDARIKINNSTVPGNLYVGQFLLKYDPTKTVSELYSDAPSGETNSQLITDLQSSPYVYHETYNSKDALFYILEIYGRDLEPGKKYYTIFNIQGTSINDMASYSIDRTCDAYTTFILKGTGRIMVDGTTDLYKESGNFCYDLAPTFSVSQLSYIDKYGNTSWVNTQDVGLYFDWFKGTESDFHNRIYKDNTAGDTLFSAADALLYYRVIYPKSSDCSLPALGSYNAAMRKVIMTLARDARGDDNTLVLMKKTYSPDITTLGTHIFLAIPVVATFTDPNNEYSVCLDEQQIVYNATDQAPKILYGIPGVSYSDRNIIPLRLGQKQIKEMTSSAKIFTVPIRSVNTVTGGSNIITTANSGYSIMADSVYLVDTDDTLQMNNAMNFKKVGIVKIITADKTLSNVSGSALKNYMQIYFDNNFASSVKEGYSYKVKLYYAERNAANTSYTNACMGNLCLYLKIVPAFENWHGGATASNQDWNNDANWRRSDNAELYKDAGSYVSNSANTTSKGLVPLEFTNVTVLKGDSVSTVPVLVSHSLNGDNVLNLSSTATPEIAYDMVLTTDGANYGCKRFFENECNELYLKPEAEIMNAQLLTYKKAHVDYELTPDRWYLLSSPLQNAYAGDMYAPKGTARQETDAFADITFDNTLAGNNRFDPAVYQRSWDKNTSIVYDYVSGGVDGQRNVYAKANWSNVYNDVNVFYASGNGFSIKAIPGAGFTAGNKVLFRLPKVDAKYYYFTKNGVQGSSKSIDRTNSGKLFTDTLTSNNGYSTTVPVFNSSTDNNLYLVGNPFPCQLNMDAFFSNSSNSALIDSKYWLMTADGQDAVIFGDKTISTASSVGTTVTPMQGFFVKLKDGVSNIGTMNLTFNKDMMTGQSAGIQSPALRAKALEKSDKLYMTASCNGSKSNMVLVRSDNASNDFNDDEDVELIDNSLTSNIPIIYSIAGNIATQINQFNSLTMIPVGVLHGDSNLVNISIKGINNFEEPVSLYDAVRNTTTAIENDTTVTFVSNAVGRYFISFNAPTKVNTVENVSDIQFYTPVKGELQIIASLSSPLQEITVYGAGGEVVAKRKGLNSVCETFTLPSGLYVIKAKSDKAMKINKVTLY